MVEQDTQAIPRNILRDNVDDEVAVSASKAVDAAKSLAKTSLEALTSQADRARDVVAPAVESVADYTRTKPLYALMGAVGVGALLTLLVQASLTRSRDAY